MLEVEMPSNHAISIVDGDHAVYEDATDRLESAGFTAKKFWRPHAFVQARCLLLCFSLGD
jgi:FixJ family two-component response regulator